MSGQMRPAVEAVVVALNGLHEAPRSVKVLALVDQAAAALAALESGLTVEALRYLLADIERCHRAGIAHSSRLETTRRAAAAAVQTDPRWAP